MLYFYSLCPLYNLQTSGQIVAYAQPDTLTVPLLQHNDWQYGTKKDIENKRTFLNETARDVFIVWRVRKYYYSNLFWFICSIVFVFCVSSE